MVSIERHPLPQHRLQTGASPAVELLEPSTIKKRGNLPSWERHIQTIDTVEKTEGDLFRIENSLLDKGTGVDKRKTECDLPNCKVCSYVSLAINQLGPHDAPLLSHRHQLYQQQFVARLTFIARLTFTASSFAIPHPSPLSSIHCPCKIAVHLISNLLPTALPLPLSLADATYARHLDICHPCHASRLTTCQSLVLSRSFLLHRYGTSNAALRALSCTHTHPLVYSRVAYLYIRTLAWLRPRASKTWIPPFLFARPLACPSSQVPYALTNSQPCHWSMLPVESILCSVHLFPWFSPNIPQTWKSSTVLGLCQTFYVNPFVNRQSYLTFA